MKFLKVGDTIFNLDNVTRIELDTTIDGNGDPETAVRFRFVGTRDVELYSGPRCIDLWNLLSRSIYTTDIDEGDLT